MNELTKNKNLIYFGLAAAAAYYFLVYRKKKAAAVPTATVLTPTAQ